MSIAFERVDPGVSSNIRQLRAHAAVVRTLLDELERAAPSFRSPVEAVMVSCRAEYLADELFRLARRMMDCAAVAALLAAPQPGRGTDADEDKDSGATSAAAASEAESRALAASPGTAHRVMGPTLTTER
jgi:hypothetical protein